MEKRRWEHIFLAYIWQYRYQAGMFILDAGIFAFVFHLYDLKTEAVSYAAGLCALLMMLVLSVHYFYYRKRHLERQRILGQIEIIDEKMIQEQIIDGQLPEPDTLAEADAWKMIRRLKQICDERQTDWQQERQEHLDYYMTWLHQIKTPIAVMRMTLQAEDTEEYRELLAQLFRIEQYTEMVLSYLRLGSESSDFVFQEYQLDDIIRQAVHKYASLFVRKRIRLRYAPSGQTVLTDEKWLLFMIEQILSNAVKYTQEGEVTITVTDEKLLRIADTGIGIASEDLPRIFEKGFTGYNGRADKKSTGLGLYLCRMAADRLSHRMFAESKVGEGTVISIDLNRKKLELF